MPAAWDSGKLMMKNAARFNVAAGIGQLFSLIGELFISLTTSLIGYLIITHSSYYQERLHSPITPTIVLLSLISHQ